jgi:hypothetical protein
VATSDLWHISSQLVHLWPHHPTYLLWPHLTSYTYHPNLYIDDHIIPHTYYGHILPLAYIIPTCTFKDGPFNLQEGGGYVFFLKKYSDSQWCWKNILILVEEKKKIWFRVFVI